MWKRDEAVKPTGPASPATPAPPAHQTQASAPAQPEPRRHQMMERDVVNIGKSVVIKGELNGSEDLTVEGHVEGKIELRDHVLTIGPNGKIKAQVFAKAVIVLGEVNGNVTATEKVDIRDGGSVDGDIVSPRVARVRTSVAASICSGRAGSRRRRRATAKRRSSPVRVRPRLHRSRSRHTDRLVSGRWFVVGGTVTATTTLDHPPTTDH